MRLSTADFDTAISLNTVRFSQFLFKDNVRVIYHARTSAVAVQIEADPPRCLMLKSICCNGRMDRRELEERPATEEFFVLPLKRQKRTQPRLEMAVEFVRQAGIGYDRYRRNRGPSIRFRRFCHSTVVDCFSFISLKPNLQPRHLVGASLHLEGTFQTFLVILVCDFFLVLQ